MKNTFLALAVGAMLVGLTSCGGDGSPLSESSAKSALKKEAIFAKDSQVRTFAVGFYEVDEDDLNKLARLKEAGMIEYTTESAVETREEREWGGYWTGYYTVTRKYVHVFADVKLTPAGQKLVIEEPTALRKDIAKDFLANKDYEEPVPPYMSASDDAFDKATAKLNGEAAKPAPAEEVAVVEEEVAEIVDTTLAVEAVEAVAEEAPAPKPAPKAAKAKANPNAAYEALVARVNTESVNVLLGRYELVKVRDILCTEDMFKAGKGSCTVLYKFVDKTPFGFVLGAPDENYVLSSNVKFTLYQDLGWTVSE